MEQTEYKLITELLTWRSDQQPESVGYRELERRMNEAALVGFKLCRPLEFQTQQQGEGYNDRVLVIAVMERPV